MNMRKRAKAFLALLLALAAIFGILSLSTTASPGPAPSVTFMISGGVHKILVPNNGLIPTASGMYAIAAEHQASPEKPWPAGMVSFRGWFTTPTPNDTDAPFDFNALIGESASIILHAVFSDKYLIKYAYATGEVIDTKELLPNAAVTQTTQPFSPPSENVIFAYWYALEDYHDKSVAPAPFMFGTIANRDLTLIPWFTDEFYIFYYISEGTQVQYDTVPSGGTATAPTAPTRLGYTFSHWSTTQGGPAYNFTTLVTDNLVLYAVWAPAPVSYTIVYWLEKPNIPGDAGTDPNNYLFHKSVPASSALSESPITVGPGSTYLVNTATLDSVDHAYYSGHFTANSTTVMGNGNTVINLFFKRTVYTIKFDLSPTLQLPPSAESYLHYATMAWAGASGLIGEQGRIGNTGSNAYVEYNTIYQFQAKLDQDIKDLWPSSYNAVFGRYMQMPATDTNSWQPQTPYYESDFLGWAAVITDNTLTSVSHRWTLTEDLLLTATNDEKTFLAIWVSDTSEFTVNYYFERLPDETGGVQVDERWYIHQADISQTFMSDQAGMVPKEIKGMEPANADMQVAPVKDFYYNRNTHKVTLDAQGGTAIKNAGWDYDFVMFGDTLDRYIPVITPTRTVYGLPFTFEGWFYDSEFFMPYVAGDTLQDSPITLFAKWAPTQLDVVFYDDLTTNSPIKSITKDLNDILTSGDAPAYAVGTFYPSKGVFNGWHVFLGTSNLTMWYPFDTPINSHLNLHATWLTTGFEVRYSIGNGTGTTPVDPNTYSLGQQLRTASGDGFSPPAGMVFIGWIEQHTNSFYYPGTIVPVTGSTLFTASYADPGQVVRIYFHPNHAGSGVSTVTWHRLLSDVSVTPPGAFWTRPGFTFNNWTLTQNGSGASFSTSQAYTYSALGMTNGEINLYAQWTEETQPPPPTPPPPPQPPPTPPPNGGDIIDEPETPLVEFDYLNHFAYIIGYDDGTVRPNNNITRAEASTVFFRLLSQVSRAEIWSTYNNFPDVAADAWYNNAISTLANGDVLQGYTDGTFAPNATITRAEFATVAVRVASGGDITAFPPGLAGFSDIVGHWAEGYIMYAFSLGYVSGYHDGSFRPNAPITRAEVATLLNNVLIRHVEVKDDMLEGMRTWTDNPEGTWFYYAIQEATNSHLYERKEAQGGGDSRYENWLELRLNPDWTALEKPNSRPEYVVY